jgi:hypothetical protein
MMAAARHAALLLNAEPSAHGYQAVRIEWSNRSAECALRTWRRWRSGLADRAHCSTSAGSIVESTSSTRCWRSGPTATRIAT